MVTLFIANEEKVMLIHAGEASIAPQTSSDMTVEDQILADDEALEPERTLAVEEEGRLEDNEVSEDDRVVVERQSRCSTDGRYGRLCITPHKAIVKLGGVVVGDAFRLGRKNLNVKVYPDNWNFLCSSITVRARSL